MSFSVTTERVNISASAARINHKLVKKKRRAQKLAPGAIASSLRRSYWTTVTARRFCDQQEMSLQIATGRSLPNDFEVMRPGLTPLLTR